jgi:hypothetical protein
MCFLLFPLIELTKYYQLKQEFDTVKELRSLSGFGWDDERKLVIASPEVWDEYLKVSLLVTDSFLAYFMSLSETPQSKNVAQKTLPFVR